MRTLLAPRRCGHAGRGCICLVVILVMATGCARPRLYPVCFYAQKPPIEEIRALYIPRLHEALRLHGSSDVVITADGRWAIARTSRRENGRLAMTWPRLACVGPARSGSEVSKEASCVKYVHEFVLGQQYLALGYNPELDIAGYDEDPDSTRAVYCDVH